MKSDTVRFRLVGSEFEIRHPSAKVWDAVADRLPPVEPSRSLAVCDRRYAAEPIDDGLLSVRRGRRRPVRANTAAAAADLIVDDVSRFLSRRPNGPLFIHAGAVSWRGKALLLPGKSGSGKSELVAALLHLGADYLSDEFALLDRDGNVQAFPRPLALRQSGGSRRLRAEELMARTDLLPIPVGEIAFLRYRGGATWAPRQISPGQAFLGLLRHMLSARQRLEAARPILRHIATSSIVFGGVRGEANEAAARLIALLR